jgi:hypothetical protein
MWTCGTDKCLQVGRRTNRDCMIQKTAVKAIYMLRTFYFLPRAQYIILKYDIHRRMMRQITRNKNMWPDFINNVFCETQVWIFSSSWFKILNRVLYNNEHISWLDLKCSIQLSIFKTECSCGILLFRSVSTADLMFIVWSLFWGRRGGLTEDWQLHGSLLHGSLSQSRQDSGERGVSEAKLGILFFNTDKLRKKYIFSALIVFAVLFSI